MLKLSANPIFLTALHSLMISENIPPSFRSISAEKIIKLTIRLAEQERFGKYAKKIRLGSWLHIASQGTTGVSPTAVSKSQHQAQPGTLYYRLTDSVLPDYSAYSNEVPLTELSVPQKWILGQNPQSENMGFSFAFLTRMLFSCLVDADWLDTEAFMKNSSVERGKFDTIALLSDKLTTYLKRFANPKRKIDEERTWLSNECIKKSDSDKGVFSLTAPTGSGKTLASLAFALSHAKRNRMQRVIYVVPYNTIIEQNAKIFEEVLGDANVVQHHGNIEYDDTDMRRFATENWDAPIIVTSTVQFFESLFSNKPGKCRKLHNIANSVIVFDEAQMLPLPYLIPCLTSVGELVRNCGCSAVLATATQSCLDEYFLPLTITEINSKAKEMYEDFRRVEFKSEDGAYTPERLVSELSEYNQVLCVVNTRKKAQELAARLKDAYHLSTTMFPAHRAEVLNNIREALKSGKPCRVISTSLIEAGVDIDFPALYRETAGLDSIIQAAGRCNREGKRRAQDSVVHVFSFDNQKQPTFIRQNISAFEHAKLHNKDIASLQSVECYFKQLRYIIGREQLDMKNAVRQFNDGFRNALSFPFRTVAEQFRLIDTDQRIVVIEKEITKEMCALLRCGVRNKALMRKIQQYSVNLFSTDYDHLRSCGLLEELDDGLAIMNGCFYDNKYGVSLHPSCGNAIIL